MTATALATREVEFMGATLMGAQDDAGTIWAGVRWICEGIGLTRGQMNNETAKIQSELALSKGARNLMLPTRGGKQEVLCLHLDYVPLWLAKISITPTMQRESPELVERLLAFQLKAKDVLAAAFLHNTPPAIAEPAAAFYLAMKEDIKREVLQELEAANVIQRPTGSAAYFVEECLVRRKGERFPASDLYSAYCEFCGIAGLEPLRQTGFGRALRELGLRKVKCSTLYYLDIRRKNA